ncbi:hypothetical protein NIES2104_17410 [Leptolyngbya sp. NIES-2104]|nr:hypothetical protein NIES2104_17410 [Leptolyngbya sp. NIES-2104]
MDRLLDLSLNRLVKRSEINEWNARRDALHIEAAAIESKLGKVKTALYLESRV